MANFQSGLTGASSSLFKTPVDNADMAPFQGFDADVFVLDQGTGNYTLIGRFLSIQITINNNPEPYLELNQRIAMLLDGELQFGFILERGQLDARVLQQTFGYDGMSRELRNNRNSRMQISFSVAAPELQNVQNSVSKSYDSTKFGVRNGSEAIASENFSNRKAYGEYVLTMCQVNSLTIDVRQGKQVIANRWQGMFEGIQYVDRSIVDPGVFLPSVTASSALEAGADSTAAGAINPFPWDNIAYTANSSTSTRVSNPLAADYGGQFNA
jgi:hypothetical protein